MLVAFVNALSCSKINALISSSVFLALESHSLHSLIVKSIPPYTPYFSFKLSSNSSCTSRLPCRLSRTRLSTVPSVTRWWIITEFFCPCLYNLAFACWYSSKLHVRPNQTIILPPVWRLSPCPAPAGWASKSGIFPSFQSLISSALSSFFAPLNFLSILSQSWR